MISRKVSFIVALAFLIGFFTSLMLDLHGAVAVILAVGFFAFTSAAIDDRTKIARTVKWCIGAMLLLEILRRLIMHPGHNYTFSLAVGVCGMLLLIDPMVLWLTRRK
jgi:hypothetical protein